MDLNELARIEFLRRWASGSSWESGLAPDGTPVVRVRVDLETWVTMRVSRESEPAGAADAEFIAAAPGDVARLAGALRGHFELTEEPLAEIAARAAAASPPPWRLYLESDGGLGGPTIIQTEGDDRDLYLTLDGRQAPDDDWIFVAAAREAIPRLLAAISAGLRM